MAAAAGRFSSVAMVLPELQSFDRFGKPIISTGERGGAGKPPSRKRRESRDGEGAALPPTGPPPLRRHLACARPGSRVPCAARPIPKGRKTNGRFVQGAGRRARYARIKSALPWGGTGNLSSLKSAPAAACRRRAARSCPSSSACVPNTAGHSRHGNGSRRRHRRDRSCRHRPRGRCAWRRARGRAR